MPQVFADLETVEITAAFNVVLGSPKNLLPKIFVGKTKHVLIDKAFYNVDAFLSFS
jgi:hypothetical protein